MVFLEARRETASHYFHLSGYYPIIVPKLGTRMRIISKKTLIQFWLKHPESEQYLKTWHETASKSEWRTPADVKQSYSTASILQDGRIIFNIKGNSFRLVVRFNFALQLGFIRFIGTHKEYDQIDANTI